MTTVATMVERVRLELHGGHRPNYNVLDGAVDDNDVVLTMILGLEGIALTTLLGLDNEIVWVQSVDRDAKTVTVIRGMYGTTAAAHADNILVEVNPKFFRAQVLTAMLEEINSWPPRVYRIGAITLDYVTDERGIDLAGIASSFYGIIGVFREPDTGIVGLAHNNAWVPVSYRLLRQQDTAHFPSGAGLVVEKYQTGGTDLRVVYNYPFDVDPFTDATILETDVGLSAGMLDALKFGVLWRMLAPNEIARLDDTSARTVRDDQAVPPMATSQAARVLKDIRDTRISEEAGRLREIWKLPAW